MIRDVKRRRMSAENFLERTRINAMRKNDVLPVEIRELADKDVNKFEMNCIPLRINNRCAVTSRWVCKMFLNHYGAVNIIYICSVNSSCSFKRLTQSSKYNLAMSKMLRTLIVWTLMETYCSIISSFRISHSRKCH